MQVILKDNRRFVLRFDKGEDVCVKLQEFMDEQKMTGCAFWGIGSCTEIQFGYYNEHLKEYRKKPYYEEMEVINFQGTGALMNDKAVVHAHGTVGRTDFTMLGGHVFKLVVSATMEIVLIQLDGALNRKNNPDFNLNLLV